MTGFASNHGTLWRYAEQPRHRRVGYAILALIVAVFVFFPRPFVARAKILPQDASSAGVSAILNSLGGQLQSFASLLSGGRPPNDLYLIIGRSDIVASDVVDTLKLAGPSRPYLSVDDAKRALAKKVDVHLLLGGVVEVETSTGDAAESSRLTDAYVRAISARIGSLGRSNITRKSEIIKERLQNARTRVSQAETALNDFRRANRLADPETQLGSALSLRAGLQGQLDAAQVKVQTLEKVRGADSSELQQAREEVTAIRRQIGQAAEPRTGVAGPNVTGLSEIMTRYFNLYRDYRFAQAIYEVYLRSSEQVAVEELVASSASYVQVVEPTHLDAVRHYNTWAVALLVALCLLAIFTEIYAPATGLFKSVPTISRTAAS